MHGTSRTLCACFVILRKDINSVFYKVLHNRQTVHPHRLLSKYYALHLHLREMHATFDGYGWGEEIKDYVQSQRIRIQCINLIHR